MTIDTKKIIKYSKVLIIMIDLLLLIPLYSFINKNLLESYWESPESLAGGINKTVKSLDPKKLDEAISKYNSKKSDISVEYLEDIFN